jgi:hypothetical protein
MIEPDTKDWTWVLQRPCPDCGFDAAEVPVDQIAERILENAARWPVILMYANAAVRPAANIWSPLEYACHVRDVHRVFAGRVRRMLTEDNPEFDNWDQDATAESERYSEQDPAEVAHELVAAAEQVAALYASVPDDAWERPGRRSNGAVFTVASLGRYLLHDLAHHLVDVEG